MKPPYLVSAICRDATRVLALVVALVPACAAAPPATTTVAIAPAPASSIVEREATPLDLVQAARRAYAADGDPRLLFALWADDMTVRAGRGRTPSDRDNVFGRARLAVIYGWAGKHEGRMTVRTISPQYAVSGDRATIEWFIVERADAMAPSAFGERYVLEKRGAWKIVRFEYWPVTPDTLAELGEYFADADAKVDAARASGDERALAFQLMAAYRFTECAEVTRRLTDATPEEPWVWEMRAKASALIGDREDADRSMAELKRRKGR